MRTLKMAVAMALIVAPRVVGAQEVGDPQKGHTYAKAVCAECHAVEAGDEMSPNPDAPSFGAVADTPAMSGRALVVWLQSPHPTMPNLMVPPEQRDNVVAYIMSLRAEDQPGRRAH